MASYENPNDAGVSDVEKMMQELGLKEEDLDDVVLDEAEIPDDAVRWVAIARVNSVKTYSHTWFFRNMRSAWDLAQEVKFRPLEDNLYTIQFSCLGDWERVMQEGPCHFRGDAVIIKPYDGVTKPTTIKLDTIDIWVQIHDVPDLFAHLIEQLAGRVGEVLYAEPPSQDFAGNFHRIWVRIDVTKPLKNDVSLVREESGRFTGFNMRSYPIGVRYVVCWVISSKNMGRVCTHLLP